MPRGRSLAAEARVQVVEQPVGLARAGAVVFDCDSTLTAIEGIDQLAESHRDEIVQLTYAAMEGTVRLEDVYGRRLGIVRPTRSRVLALADAYLAALLPDAREVVQVLVREGIGVRIMSGGLLPAVRAVGAALGLPDDAIAAVDVSFDEAGEYTDFDRSSPLARSGGKRDVLAAWSGELARPIWMVGDGRTDAETRPVADVFIAFAGVVEHESAVAVADATIRTRSLAPLLPLALGGRGPGDPAARAVYERGIALLESGASLPSVVRVRDTRQTTHGQ